MYSILAILFISVHLLHASEDGRCVMRGECGIDDLTFLPKPCVYNGSPTAIKTEESTKFLKEVCPGINPDSVCCDDSQVASFEAQFSSLSALFRRCPACIHNLANVFCQMICSPTQSRFLTVTDSAGSGLNTTVNSIDYSITECYANGLFNSCKNVQIAVGPQRVIEIACGAHGKDCSPFRWLEYMGTHDPSPFQINFKYNDYGMGNALIPCDKPSFFGQACSKEDCPRGDDYD
ncbi:NPC intracellular cholesterol transporter 1-like [Parasteatoda tepidariorum]|uniref:NPC intracellular cholesterol transporter 1-like n=1 Tax=Parasteatoda tepidariorum TaxID=114398 RepID=UPI001C725BA6|nr:NPC intracellular cholesterol transporter 1-like [Parasteatoda tepidariorum]